MENSNKGSLQTYNTVTSFSNLTSDAVDLFIQPALKRMLQEISKILKKACDDGELKDFKYLEFRVETNVYKEIFEGVK